MKFLLLSTVILPAMFLTSACVATHDDVSSIYARQNKLEAMVKQLSENMGSLDGGRGEVRMDPDISDRVFKLEVRIYDIEQKLSLFEKQLDALIKSTGNKDLKSIQLPKFPAPRPRSNTRAPFDPLQGNNEKQVREEVEERDRAVTGSEEKVGMRDAANPEEELEEAYKDSRLGNYASARKKSRNFLREYPSSRRSHDATFMIADSYYREGLYEEAVIEYQEFIYKYSGDQRVPLAYLRQGLSFIELDKIEQARLFLKTLIDEYPDSKESDVARKLISELGQSG